MTATAPAEKKPIPLEQIPNECDILQKKVFDLPFDVIVSGLIGLKKVLVLRVIEKISGFERRLSELEEFRDVVVKAHMEMQAEAAKAAEAEAAKAAANAAPAAPATPALAVVPPAAPTNGKARAPKPAPAKPTKDGGAA